MPQPRKYPSNAARQAAYRARKRESEQAKRAGVAESAGSGRTAPHPLVDRIIASDAAQAAREP